MTPTITPYAQGNNWTLYAGECGRVMRACIEDESIDLVVTSPPYDPVKLVDGRLVTDCANGQRDYNGYKWDFVEIATELWRVAKKGGVLVWVVGDKTIDGSETGTPERQKLFFMDLGFRCHDTMIYESDGTGAKGSHYAYWQAYEFMYIFSKGQPKAIHRIKDKVNKSNGSSHSYSEKMSKLKTRTDTKQKRTTGKYSVRTNIWRYLVGSANGDDCTDHPAPFPEALARDHILSWSNPGDIVLDCFAGSGTTAKAALMTGRRTIGIDISSEYLEIAKKRIDLTRLPLFEQVEEERPHEQLTMAI